MDFACGDNSFIMQNMSMFGSLQKQHLAVSYDALTAETIGWLTGWLVDLKKQTLPISGSQLWGLSISYNVGQTKQDIVILLSQQYSINWSMETHENNFKLQPLML